MLCRNHASSSPWKCIVSFTAFITILLYLNGCSGNGNEYRTEEQQQDAINASPASVSRTTAEPLITAASGINFTPVEWELAGQLPKGLYDHAAAVWNGFLYISGGFGPGPDVNTDEIYIFRIMPDNTVDLHEVATIPDKALSLKNGAKGVVKGIDGHAMAVYNGYLYIMGGKFQYVRTDCYPPSSVPCFSPTPTAWNNSVFYTAINSDSTLSDWHEVPLPENAGTYTPGVIIVNGYLYIIGGWDGERNTAAVSSAPILPDGRPGQWNDETPLPVGLSKHAVTVSGDFIYVVGGNTGMATMTAYSQGYSAAVYYAKIEGGHTIGDWQLAEPLPDTWIDHKVVAVGNRLFAIGGRNVNEYYHYTGDYYDYIIHDTVLYSNIGHDGTLSIWSSYNSLPVPVVRHAVAAEQGIIFSTGGSSGQDTDNISCIQGICSAPYIRESGIYLLDLR